MSTVPKKECLKICILKKSDVGMAWNHWSKNNSLMAFYSYIFRKKPQLLMPYFLLQLIRISYLTVWNTFILTVVFFTFIPLPVCQPVTNTYGIIFAGFIPSWRSVWKIKLLLSHLSLDSDSTQRVSRGSVSNMVWLQCSLATDLRAMCTLSLLDMFINSELPRKT